MKRSLLDNLLETPRRGTVSPKALLGLDQELCSVDGTVVKVFPAGALHALSVCTEVPAAPKETLC